MHVCERFKAVLQPTIQQLQPTILHKRSQVTLFICRFMSLCMWCLMPDMYFILRLYKQPTVLSHPTNATQICHQRLHKLTIHTQTNNSYTNTQFIHKLTIHTQTHNVHTDNCSKGVDSHTNHYS